MISLPLRHAFAIVIACLWVIVTANGCKQMLQRTYKAEVWFASAPAIATGTPVTLGEHAIGITGQASVHSGALQVPVILNTPDAVPDETIFVLTDDPRGSRLVAHPRGQPLHLSGTTFRFRGAAGQAEYWLMLAKERVQQFTK